MPCGASAVGGDCARYSDLAAGETLGVETEDGQGGTGTRDFGVSAFSGAPEPPNFLLVPSVPQTASGFAKPNIPILSYLYQRTPAGPIKQVFHLQLMAQSMSQLPELR